LTRSMWASEVEARVFTSVRKICQDFGASQCILTLRLVGQARGFGANHDTLHSVRLFMLGRRLRVHARHGYPTQSHRR
jgi:hypothetical protein